MLGLGRQSMGLEQRFMQKFTIVERVDRLLALVDELAAQVSERKSQADALMQAVLREAFGNS